MRGLHSKLNTGAIILGFTNEPEQISASAAKISTTEGSALEIYYNKSDSNKANKLVSKVLKCGHKSIIEHVNFTIAFNNVSVFVEQFMIEFRLASFTIKSRRYVDFRSVGYFIPEFKTIEQLNEKKHKVTRDLYIEHMDYLFSEYENLIENGIPKEDARFILPYSFKSNFYCTVNARELTHIIYSAIWGRGRKFNEIRNIGENLLEQARVIFPGIFENINEIERGREDKSELLDSISEKYKVNRGISDNQCELLNHTMNPDKQVAISALINNNMCSTSRAIELVDANSDLLKDCIEIVLNDRRKRELEHIYFTFRINNLSLAGLTHIVRHRIQSISIPSLGKIGESDKFIMPPSIVNNKVSLEKYIQILDNHKKVRKQFEELGVDQHDLVYMCLSGDLLDVITTMNARELHTFFQLRTCNRAQWEIKDIAIQMLSIAKQAAPLTFSMAGPSCFSDNRCPEGKLSCGKITDVKSFFMEL